MDLRELESYRLSDAVKFNDRLNPRLWGTDERLLPEVRQRLLDIADDFRESLGIDVEIKDITVSGSNAAYTYTPHSDIDLHLVVDLPRADESDVYRELFDAKKYQYNDQHDFKIGGYDVELYVQNANEPHHSQGIYSVLNNDWVRVPSRRRPEVNDISVRSKYEDLGRRIESAIESGDLATMDALSKKIKNMRQSGLDQHGEFGPENLAFKVLRNNGTLDKLRSARLAAKDDEMSLTERKKKKKKTRYGFGGYWFPGYHYYGDTGAAADGGGDGGGGGESVRENQEDRDPYEVFVEYVCGELDIKDCPRIKIRRDPQWAKVNGTFGRYDPEKNTLEVSVAGRHMADVMRTLAHELVHHHQEEREGIPANGGETGSRFEDEANAHAGRIMRDFREAHPEIFANKLSEQLDQPTPTAQEIIRKHKMSEQEFIQQLRQGIKVELEHTTDARAAMEIAMDHLNERPDYYTMLAAVERPMGEAIQTPVSQDPKHIKQYYDFLQGKARMGRPLSKTEQQFLTSYHAIAKMKGQVAESDLDEDLRRAVAGAAAAACIAGTPGCATTQGPSATDALRTIQTIGRAAKNLPTKAGAEEELRQELKNWLRRQGGHTDQPTRLPLPDIKKQTNESSGYIPTEKERNDPRFSMALTVDVKPGQTGKEANKLGLKTDSQGRPALLMKKLNNLLESIKLDEEILDEVEMSPTAFKKFLNSPEAEGIRAGFEAELIFRNTQSDADGSSGESEPNWEADERAYSIQDIIDFFTGGDGIGRRAADRLAQEMTEQFSDWAREQFANEYFDQDRFMSWAEENIWEDEADNYREQARDALGDEEISDEELEKQAVQLFRDDVERDWDRSGDWYEQASEELYDEYMADLDESEWLDESGLRWMSDISNEYELDWPYWTDGGGSGGERNWDEISNSLERVTGKDVRVSSGYHQAIRRENQYIIEPDSSLDADDSEDYGLEVVSPPMPLPEAIEQLNRIIDWANGEGDAYTNSSTGIHMGVSLPFKGGDVDPIKLILFMGDKDLLEKFDRASNHYTRSAYDKLQEKIRGMKNAGPKQIEGIMELMKSNLIELADRELKRGVLGEKYVSVKPHDGYIEFRGPGGDYLSKESEIDGVLENTMLRLAYAMSIAGSPDLYRKEYAKKLYKVLTKDDPSNPFMKLFSDYSAGDISGEELKRQWAETVLRAEKIADKDEDVPMGTAKDYEIFDRDTGRVLHMFRAYNDEEAMDQFTSREMGMRLAPYRDQGISYFVRLKAPEPKDKDKDKTPPSRRAELAKRVTRSTKDVGEQLWRVNYHSSVKYVIANSQAEAIEKASMIDRSFASDETRARLADKQELETYRIDQEREQQRAAQPQGEWTGHWVIKDAQGRELTRFHGIGNSQHDANRYAAGWLGRNRPDLVGQEIEVVPEMR